MTAWRGLASVVAELRALALRTALPPGVTRDGAAMLATAHVGMAGVLDAPAWVNVAALALATRERLLVHELRTPVPRIVDETDLHALPDEPPALLRGPVIVEVRTPGVESLMPGTLPGSLCCSLGCYELDSTRYLIGLEYPDGIAVVRWAPTWPGGEIADGVTAERDASLIETIGAEAHAAWGRSAARLLVVLGLLLDATGAPLRTTDDGPQPRRTTRGEVQPARPWAVRRVYLDGGAAGHAGVHGAGAGAGTEGRAPVEVAVRGHLKRQRSGPGGAERRWIYVAQYGARRWVAPQVRTVVAERRTR